MPNNLDTPLFLSKMSYISPAIQDEEAEETASLSNSPRATESATQFATEPSELFEFFSGSDNNLSQIVMSHAEDIIFCGKIIPLKQQERHDNQKNCDNTRNVVKREEEEREISSGSHNRRPSTELRYATQPNSPRSKKLMMRSSRSLDYEHLRRSLSSDYRGAGIRRYSSTRSSDRYDNSGQKVYKPRWYSMLFGLVSKIPPETMELRDMKNRLVRRTPATMFPQSDSSAIYPPNKNQRKSTWGLLSVLSCKDDTSIGITTSIGCMPQVNRCDNTVPRATCA